MKTIYLKCLCKDVWLFLYYNDVWILIYPNRWNSLPKINRVLHISNQNRDSALYVFCINTFIQSFCYFHSATFLSLWFFSLFYNLCLQLVLFLLYSLIIFWHYFLLHFFDSINFVFLLLFWTLTFFYTQEQLLTF